MWILIFPLLSIFLRVNAIVGQVACSGTGLDWYMNMVGETPCTTYERLRQICNPSFQVGTLNTNTPPDACNEQVADCCCNSVAFTLSMLCLNCQQNIGTGSGYDAGKGAYQSYLQGSRSAGSWCSPVTNQSLPHNIDNAVCDNNIKIIDDIRTGLFWADGSWFYMWSYEAISKDVNANGGNAFTHCASIASTSTSTSTSSTSISSPTTSITTVAGPISGQTGTVTAQGTGSSKGLPSPSPNSNSFDGASTSIGPNNNFSSASVTVILGITSTVYPSSSTSSSTSSSGNSNSTTPNQTLLASSPMSKGLIGGIVGAVTGGICALLTLWFCCRLRKCHDVGTKSRLRMIVEPFEDRQRSGYTLTGSISESSTPLVLRPQKLQLEDLRNSTRTRSQATSVHYDASTEIDGQRDSQIHPDSVLNSWQMPLSPLRHTDAGPVQVQIAERRMSESLPPAYGEQIS
ncbi:hypothetical protein GGU10DRAFT_85488 [Lentinula aff. detonsa]|uniref:Uncharacterized protein n=1 Tax=Lentinula aff. detonsa TaxID=2804958 RepID=A0AA38L0U7_9AGAR|nr:hypothetical protein GGU10DRAFT_85488 [Lentinula aff. detonsa]